MEIDKHASRCAQTGKAEEKCFECGAYQGVATSQDLDTPPKNIEKMCIISCDATSGDLEKSQDTDTRFCPNFH